MKFLKLKVNLLSVEELEEKALGKLLKWSLTFGRYIIVGTEIIVLTAFFSRFKLDRQLTDLHEQISQKEAIVKFNLEFEKEVREIQKQLSEIKNIEQNHDLSLKLLSFLGGNTPKEVVLKSLSLSSQEKITLSGVSPSTSSFVDFLARIRTSDKFSQVVLQDLSEQEGKGLEFKLTANVSKKNF